MSFNNEDRKIRVALKQFLCRGCLLGQWRWRICVTRNESGNAIKLTLAVFYLVQGCHSLFGSMN